MNGGAAALIPIDFAPVDATLRWQDEVRAGRAALRAAFLERADTPRSRGNPPATRPVD
jgi:hypothetical protein